MCQITHMGHRTLWDVEDWLPPVAPSPVREHAHRSFPKEMDRGDIRRVVRAFGDAAVRCKEGGLDGVELLAYGHLIHQFWTPLVNRRTDEYGGKPREPRPLRPRGPGGGAPAGRETTSSSASG